jgi:hypothetical protein
MPGSTHRAHASLPTGEPIAGLGLAPKAEVHGGDQLEPVDRVRGLE